MSEWRHVITETVRHVSCSDCCCTTPTPDPSSPCGVEGCIDPDGPGYRQRLPHYVHPAGHDKHAPIASCHPHQPTRCTCGHSIEPVR